MCACWAIKSHHWMDIQSFYLSLSSKIVWYRTWISIAWDMQFYLFFYFSFFFIYFRKWCIMKGKYMFWWLLKGIWFNHLWKFAKWNKKLNFISSGHEMDLSRKYYLLIIFKVSKNTQPTFFIVPFLNVIFRKNNKWHFPTIS
jgi:hypothetical protein